MYLSVLKEGKGRLCSVWKGETTPPKSLLNHLSVIKVVVDRQDSGESGITVTCSTNVDPVGRYSASERGVSGHISHQSFVCVLLWKGTDSSRYSLFWFFQIYSRSQIILS